MGMLLRRSRGGKEKPVKVEVKPLKSKGDK